MVDGNTEDNRGDVFQSLRDARVCTTRHPNQMASENDEVLMDYANEPGSLLWINGLAHIGASGMMEENTHSGGRPSFS